MKKVVTASAILNKASSVALDIASVVGIYLLGRAVAIAAVAATKLLGIDSILGRQGMTLLAYIVSGIAMVAMLFVVLRLRQISRLTLLLGRPKLQDAGNAVVGYGVYMVILIVVLTLITAFLPMIRLDQVQQIGIDKQVGGIALVPVFVALVITPVVTEELLFRGYLYNRMRNHIGFMGAAVTTSALFAVLHGQTNVAIDTFTLSLVMVYLYEKHASLWITIGMHTIKNSVAFVGLFLL